MEHRAALANAWSKKVGNWSWPTNDYEQVCSLAGDLLAETTVSRWVIRAFPIVVVDEFQDSKGGQLAMISSLSSLATCIVAADDFQDLEAHRAVNPAVAWARTNGESESLSDIRRYPRRQQFVFRVQVPADWGDKDLIWTLTANGKAEQAFGSLWLSWQIDEGVVKANRGMGLRGAPTDNQHPTIMLAGGARSPEMQVGVSEPLTVTVAVGDDGIPGPRPAPSDPAADARRRQRPHPMNQAVVNAFDAAETGLAVTWVHYRGPGDATFDPMTILIDGGRGGEATTSVRFTEPGTHVIRAHADDSITTTPLDVTVTVQ